jgi:sporulation protein YlmC with PRC-barrel domain
MVVRYVCVGLTTMVLAGSVALAQTNDAKTQDKPTVAQPVHKADAPAADQPPDMFVTRQDPSEWRAPKLVGVGVYDEADKKVGTIKDVLIDHNGTVQIVVIGIGGFLGIGTKDIGVPFAAIQWRTEGRLASTMPASPLGSSDSEGKPTKAVRTDRAATEASQGYPDRAVLNATLAQLKSAPDFEYAPDPLAQLDASPPPK